MLHLLQKFSSHEDPDNKLSDKFFYKQHINKIMF